MKLEEALSKYTIVCRKIDKNTAVKCGIAVYSTTDKAITIKDEWKELLK